MSRAGVVVACVAVFCVVVVGCAEVPIQRAPARPHTTRFVDPHGRPRAYGGGVCLLRGVHEHVYPAVPKDAFVDDDGAWRDTRPRVAYDGPHPWKNGRCTLPRFHEHVSPSAAPPTP